MHFEGRQNYVLVTYFYSIDTVFELAVTVNHEFYSLFTTQLG